mmetsp:Transcript_2276/g.5030  ORF Transcript_2276/g.5030 Transcript_2276/m.5030 type:complete len:276 (-) Transcript_2276:290-1117(-)
MTGKQHTPGKCKRAGQLADGDHTLRRAGRVIQVDVRRVLSPQLRFLPPFRHHLFHVNIPPNVHEHRHQNGENQPDYEHSANLHGGVVDTASMAVTKSPVVLPVVRSVVLHPSRLPLGQPGVQLLRDSEGHRTGDQVRQAKGSHVILVLLRHFGPDLLVRGQLSVVLNLPLPHPPAHFDQDREHRPGNWHHQEPQHGMNGDSLVLEVGPGMNGSEPRNMGEKAAKSLALDAHEALVGMVRGCVGRRGVATVTGQVVVPLLLVLITFVFHLRHLQNQ